jgi:glycine cleavage system protein P-like pyridoxal-binding family
MWVSFIRGGKMQLGVCVMVFNPELDNGPKQIKDFLKGHPTSCLKMIQ